MYWNAKDLALHVGAQDTIQNCGLASPNLAVVVTCLTHVPCLLGVPPTELGCGAPAPAPAHSSCEPIFPPELKLRSAHTLHMPGERLHVRASVHTAWWRKAVVAVRLTRGVGVFWPCPSIQGQPV